MRSASVGIGGGREDSETMAWPPETSPVDMLVFSVARVVHLAEVDMTKAVEYREANKQSFKEAQAADLSYNAILIKATVSSTARRRRSFCRY